MPGPWPLYGKQIGSDYDGAPDGGDGGGGIALGIEAAVTLIAGRHRPVFASWRLEAARDR